MYDNAKSVLREAKRATLWFTKGWEWHDFQPYSAVAWKVQDAAMQVFMHTQENKCKNKISSHADWLSKLQWRTKKNHINNLVCANLQTHQCNGIMVVYSHMTPHGGLSTHDTTVNNQADTLQHDWNKWHTNCCNGSRSDFQDSLGDTINTALSHESCRTLAFTNLLKCAS